MTTLRDYCSSLNKLCCGAYCSQEAKIADAIVLSLASEFDDVKIGELDEHCFNDFQSNSSMNIKGVDSNSISGYVTGVDKFYYVDKGERGLFKYIEGYDKNIKFKKIHQKPNLKLLKYLDSQVSKPFTPKEFREDIKSIDDCGEYLKPYDLTVIKDKTVHDFLLKRAEVETIIGHFLQLSTSLFVACAATDFKQSQILGYLKYYISHLEGEVGVMDNRSNKMQVYEKDVMAPQRILTLINAHIFNESQIELKLDLDAIMLEAALFIFNSPYENTKSYKSMLSNCLNMCFANSTHGQALIWKSSGLFPGSKMEECKIADISQMDPMNDRISYQLFKEAIASDIKKLYENNLLATAKWVKEIISAPVTAKALRQITHIRSIFAWAGFTKTFIPISHENQVTAERKKDPSSDIDEYVKKNNFDYPWTPNINSLVRRMLKEGLTENRFMSCEEWMRGIPSLLTSSSPGVQKSSVPEVDQRKISVKLPGKTSDYRENQFTFTAKSRAARFMLDPFKDIDRNNATNTYSQDKPGKTGTRFVVAGKAARMIIPSHNMLYFLQNIFYTPLINYALHAMFDKLYTNFFSSRCFHYGVDTGILLADYAAFLDASTNGKAIIFISDFTTLDATLNDANFRSKVRQAIIDYCVATGQTGPWGSKAVDLMFKDGIPEIINLIWGKGTTYDVHMVSSEAGVEKEFILDMVLSGELMTSILDSIATHSNFESFMDFMAGSEIMNKMNLQCFNILGDDFIGVFLENAQLTSNDILTFCTKFSQFTTYNNLKIKSGSSMMRRYGFEYLKKWHFYGYYMPLLHMQLFASERVETAVDPVERCSSYRSVMALFAERGLAHSLTNKLFIHTWNVHRGIKSRVKSKDGTGILWYYLPYQTVYMPISRGGVGKFPGTTMGANNDGPIMLEAHINNPELLRDLTSIIDITYINKSNIMQNLAQTISKGEVTTPLKPFEKGKDYIRRFVLRKEIIDQSRIAINYLEKANLPTPHSMQYEALPDRIAETVVYGIKDVHIAVEYIKSEQVKKYIYLALSPSINKQKVIPGYEWLNVVKYELKEQMMKDDGPNYFSALDPFVSKLSSNVGFAKGLNLTVDTIKNISRLITQDINLPRDVRVEFIINYLSNPMLSDIKDFLYAGMALGLSVDTTNQLHGAIQGFERKIELAVLSDLVSWNDSFFPNLDLSEESIERYITFDEVRKDIRGMMFKTSILFIMLKYLQSGVMYHLNLHSDDFTRLQFDKLVYKYNDLPFKDGLPKLYNEGYHYRYGGIDFDS